MRRAFSHPTRVVPTVLLALAAQVLAIMVLGALQATPASAQSQKVYVAGDIADCSGRSNSVANFLDNNSGPFLAPGDLAYDNGSNADFANCYNPRFGVHKSRTFPAPGNHEYNTPGAAGYFNYFGSRVGSQNRGWYETTINGWQVITLDSNCFLVGGCGAGSDQYQWLQSRLAARPNACRIAQWHHPRFTSSVSNPDFTGINPLFQLLYQAGTDLVMQGHAHHYERFAPMNPSGAIDSNRGIRTFVVGTGGAVQRGFGTAHLGSAVRRTGTFGLLELTLNQSSYSWQFRTTNGPAINDTGSDTCHNATGGGGTPVAVSSCATTLPSASTALVQWTRAANDNAAFYVVERSRNNGAWFWAGRRTSPATSINNANLASGNTYRYRVITLSASGARSAARTCSGSASPGGGGGNAVAVVSCWATRQTSNAINITWTPSGNANATAHVIYRSRNGGPFFWAGRVGANARNWVNGSLRSGEYTYRVQTIAANGTRADHACGGSPAI